MSHYDLLVDAGYESITLAAKDMAAWDERTMEQYREKLEAGPLHRISLNSFCTPDLRLCGKGYDPQRVREYMTLIAARGASLGFRYVGIGAPGSRNLQPRDNREIAWNEFLQTIRILCDVAAEYGMEVLIESVCSLECNFITTTREALKLVREADRRNLHLVYDIYHEMMENQPLDVIEEVGSEIRVVHIAEADNGQRIYLKNSEKAKYEQYWKALQQAGYDGEWNLECFAGKPAKELPISMKLMEQMRQNCAV